MLRTQGWRHFEATEVTVKNKKDVQVKLTATCDRSIDVWVSVSDLKNRNKWSAGWKQKEELLWTGDANSEYGAVAAPKSGYGRWGFPKSRHDVYGTSLSVCVHYRS